MEYNSNVNNSNIITREYFDSLLIEMRHIDAVLPNTTFEIFGETFATPITTTALSHLNNHHPQGMVELARGVKAANTLMFAGMGDEAELEAIISTGAKVIKIIKTYADNDIIFRKIAHAEAKGCLAVGMDFDHAYNGLGEYDVIDGMKMSGKTLDELKLFVSATKLPFIVKGVLSVTDAKKCLEAGVQGIVVSHHAGIMSCAVPPLMVLPSIVKAILQENATTEHNKQMKIFVDCGVQNGYDAFKALALGADAVSVGRALLPSLTATGASGVSDTIQEFTSQLAGVMARTASSNLSKIDSSYIWRRGSYE